MVTIIALIIAAVTFFILLPILGSGCNRRVNHTAYNYCHCVYTFKIFVRNICVLDVEKCDDF